MEEGYLNFKIRKGIISLCKRKKEKFRETERKSERREGGRRKEEGGRRKEAGMEEKGEAK